MIIYICEQEGRRPPDTATLRAQAFGWHRTIGFLDKQQAMERIRRYYEEQAAKGMARRITAFDIKGTAQAPWERTVADATGATCPWPGECRCSHTRPCDRGWIENDGGTVRQCPNCRPTAAKTLAENPRDVALAKLRRRDER